MKTFEELVQYAITEMIKQGRASKNITGSCMYRGPEGTKCAIGMLISDEHYTASLENLPSVNMNVFVAVSSSHPDISFGSEEKSVLQFLQTCHDTVSVVPNQVDFIDAFKNAVRKTVSENNLPEYCLKAIGD